MLEDAIKKAVIEDLKKNRTFADRYVQNNPIILDAYHRKIVSDGDIELVLHQDALKSGRKSYDFCTKHPDEFQPDHFLSKCLAYALAVGEISAKEAKKLRFCHGETINSFIAGFLPKGPKEYIQELRKKLLGQDKDCEEDTWGMRVRDLDYNYLDEYCDPHPACCGH